MLEGFLCFQTQPSGYFSALALKGDVVSIVMETRSQMNSDAVLGLQ